MIETYHPTNPETREKFSIFDSVTVYNYGLKLTDACGVMAVISCFKKVKSRTLKIFKVGGKKKFKRPETMNDLPDSDSSDDNLKNDTYKGLSEASIYLGEGAVIYLQMMKTMAILFFLLTIINCPLYLFLQGYTLNNNYMSLDMFSYFTIGNLGVPDSYCGFSYILYDQSKSVYTDQRKEGNLNSANSILSERPLLSSQAKIKVKCSDETDYIHSYSKVGFIQALNAKYEKFNTPEDQC